jgi:hypothetical protein
VLVDTQGTSCVAPVQVLKGSPPKLTAPKFEPPFESNKVATASVVDIVGIPRVMLKSITFPPSPLSDACGRISNEQLRRLPRQLIGGEPLAKGLPRRTIDGHVRNASGQCTLSSGPKYT